MATLFPIDDDGAAKSPEAPVLATAEQVRLLEGFNYKIEVVRKWSFEKASTVLRKCQNEERLALNRGKIAALAQDDIVLRGQPSKLERCMASAYIEEDLGKPDDLMVSVSCALAAATDDHLKQVAELLLKLWAPDVAFIRNPRRASVPPDQGERDRGRADAPPAEGVDRPAEGTVPRSQGVPADVP